MFAGFSVDVIPSKRKIKTHESDFKLFVSIFQKLEEIII